MIINKMISVIIPVYNAGKYIERCLNSIITSSYLDLEIICVNDGSTDESQSILMKYVHMDSRISVIELNHKGVSAARNAGLKQANGKYIAFVDADDWVHEKYFELLLKTMESKQCDIVVSNFVRAADYEIESPRMPFAEAGKYILQEMWLKDRSIKYYVWGKLFKKEVVCGHFFKEGYTIAEDVLYIADIFLTNPDLKVYKITDSLYYYYDHDSSTVHTYNYEEKVKAFQSLYHILSGYSSKDRLVQLYYLEM